MEKIKVAKTDSWWRKGFTHSEPFYDTQDGIVTMEGQKILRVETLDDDKVIIGTDAGTWLFTHNQDCCESVTLSELSGWDERGVDDVILVAEVRTADISGKDYGDSGTATFYSIQTNSLDLAMHWQGLSNGYYSESVNVYFAEGKSIGELYDDLG